MRITQLGTRLEIDPPPTRPVTDALRANLYPGRVHVTIHTNAGFRGHSRLGFASIRGANETFQRMLDAEVAPLVEGRNPFEIRKIHEDLKRALEEQAIHGMTQYALSVVNIALWDIMGQETGLPVHRLLGQAKDRVAAYAMVGWMDYGLAELREACSAAVEQGFRAVKIKVGAATVEEDVRRIEAVRGEIGPDIRLMVDVNQTLTRFEALRRGQVYQELGVLWLEEPLAAHDYDGHCELARALAMPVAAGENLYGKEEFGEMFVRHGMDIVQLDLARLGGPSECIATGLTAASFRLPCCTHGGGLVNLNILCALPNAMYLETGLMNDEWRERFVDGDFLAPEGPGFCW